MTTGLNPAIDPEEKARKVVEAANQLQRDYEAEGRADLAKRVADAFDALPVGSLSKLYDILKG